MVISFDLSIKGWDKIQLKFISIASLIFFNLFFNLLTFLIVGYLKTSLKHDHFNFVKTTLPLHAKN